MPLSNETKALLDGPNFAHLATLMPDGSPQSVTCRWKKPVELAGFRSTEYVSSGVDDIQFDKSKDAGYAVGKIANGDKFAMIGASYGEDLVDFAVDEILGEGDIIDTGAHRLRVLHTPGHSSGCISLLEEQTGLLVTGDLMLSGGHLGGVFGSGNISDMIYSLERLGTMGARLHLTGHGRLSDEPAKDTERALTTCRQILSDTRSIFETLNAQDSTNQFFLTLRDLF